MLIITIGMDMCRQDTRRLAAFQYHGTGAITKQDAGGTIRPVQDPCDRLGTHHQYTARITCTDILIGDAHGIDKPGAYCLHIERRTAVDTQPLLQ